MKKSSPFLSFALPALGGTGLFWNLSQFATSGVLVVVPEPGRVMLLLLGVTSLITRRRLRGQQM